MRQRRAGRADEVTGAAAPGSLTAKDSARRTWGVDVRRDGRGRYLQFRPIGIDAERFRASADGHLAAEWLPIEPEEWELFARAASPGGQAGPDGGAELSRRVRRLVDRMVREAQHRGLVFDDDED
jgi:hypothetical protein